MRIQILSLLSIALFSLLLTGSCNPAEPTSPLTNAPRAPATPTPAPDPISAGRLAITYEETLGREIIATFTEDEQSCIRTSLGDDAYRQLLDQPIAGPSGVEPFPLDCLSPPKRAAGFAVAVISSISGGMTTDSQDCLRALYTETNQLEFPLRLSNERADILLTLRFLLCLTDDEAQRLTSQPGTDAMDWSPSVLACVDERVGIDRLVDAFVMLTEDPLQLPQADEEVLQLLPACGAVEFFPAPPPEGTFDRLSQQWLQQDPSAQVMIDCLLGAASVEELDAFFAGFRPVPPPGVAECLGK